MAGQPNILELQYVNSSSIVPVLDHISAAYDLRMAIDSVLVTWLCLHG